VGYIKKNIDTSQKKILLYAIGITCLISNSFVLYFTFLWAYFSNDYIFSASINDFGEAHIELIFLTFSLAIGLYAVVNLFKNIPKKDRDI